MKYYLIVTGMTVGSLVAIIEADSVTSMIGEPEYIKPIKPKVFWARSEKTRKKAEEKVELFQDLGYEKDLTFDPRGLIKILFGYIPVAK